LRALNKTGGALVKIKTHGLRLIGRLFLKDGKEKGGRSIRTATG
jgi:hypothetical protein